MNVVHYVASFSTLSQTFIYDLIVGLEERGLAKNTVLTRRREMEKERPFDRTFICKDRNPIRKFISKFTDPSHLQIHNKKIILDRFKEAQVDIVHSHFAVSALRMHDLLMSRKLTIPHICSFHGNDVQANPHKIKGYKEALLKLNDYPNLLMTVPSQFLKDVCVELGLDGNKIQIVHNTVHPRFINGPQAKAWNGKEKLKIITIGRLVEMKGHEYAIKAMAILKEKFQNFEYIIAGPGFLESSLKKLTSDLELDDNVKFLGSVPHDELPLLLSKSHICLTPSILASNGEEDTFCLTLVEGSIAGLYCLSTDTRGPVEVLGQNKEFIFPQKNPKAMSEAILSVINNFEVMESRSKNLREYMIRHYHPDAYFKEYHRIYNGLINK